MEKIYEQFDIETIEKLAEIVKKNELSEITISDGEKAITIKGKKCPPPPPMPMSAPVVQSVPNVAVAALNAEINTEPKISGNSVTSPIVGTFYASPAPDKDAFVTIGAKVSKGDVICIVESMKLMNEITSEFSGTVKEICVNSGDPVEFGQTLMIIE